jgi:two-component system, NtrC family, response regulator AtoC
VTDQREDVTVDGATDSRPESQAMADAANESKPGYTWDGLGLTLRDLMAKAEIQAIRRALEHTGWNRKQAAQLLRISYRGLLYKMRNHSITRSQ